MDDERGLSVVPDPERCPFTQQLGGNKFVCTKAPHRPEQGHNMVGEKEALKHGFI